MHAAFRYVVHEFDSMLTIFLILLYTHDFQLLCAIDYPKSFHSKEAPLPRVAVSMSYCALFKSRERNRFIFIYLTVYLPSNCFK